jgi:hypothetical protein
LAAGRLEQLYVEGAALDIRRAKDRSIWIAGLQLSALDNAPDAASDFSGPNRRALVPQILKSLSHHGTML